MAAFLFDYPYLAGLLFFSMVAAGLYGMILAGMRLGRRVLADKENAPTGIGAVEAAVFGLFGLLLAFTFSGAADRLRTRKDLILREAQVAGTLAARFELLAEPAKSDLKKLLRDYLDRKLAAYADLRDLKTFDERMSEVEGIGIRIQARVVEAVGLEANKPVTGLVMGPLSDLQDVGLARRAGIRNHPPLLVYVLLLALGLVAALMVGFAMGPSKKPSVLHQWLFPLVIAATVTVTLDAELPRFGMIRADGVDVLLKEVADSLR